MTLLQRFSWCGVQVPDFRAAVHFYTELLGMRLIKLAPDRDLAIWALPSGQGFEIFGPRHTSYGHWQQPVLSFDVPSVRAARSEQIGRAHV